MTTLPTAGHNSLLLALCPIGTVLVMVYFILLAVYFFAPSPSGC